MKTLIQRLSNEYVATGIFRWGFLSFSGWGLMAALHAVGGLFFLAGLPLVFLGMYKAGIIICGPTLHIIKGIEKLTTRKSIKKLF